MEVTDVEEDPMNENIGSDLDESFTDDEQPSGEQSALCGSFYGCYCLVSKSEKKYFKGRTYIGFTVNPNRRIIQHNSGRHKGGAKKTDSRGPWDMVMIVHGFMNNTDALRFEWAWQNPDKSRLVHDSGIKKKNRESPFSYRFRLACAMMRLTPWSLTPLTLRWLIPSYRLPIPIESPLLPHHCEAVGVLPKERSQWPYVMAAAGLPVDIKQRVCRLCNHQIKLVTDLSFCWQCTTDNTYHITCLAEHNLTSNLLRPIDVRFDCCLKTVHWSQVVRHMRALQKRCL